MNVTTRRAIWIISASFFLLGAHAHAESTGLEACAPTARACLLDALEDRADRIGEDRWRDQTYRDLAKLRMHEGQTDQALALIEKVKNPDTRAMTIRAIGMEASSRTRGEKMDEDALSALFAQLHAHAARIDHAPSKGIALTYIAMAQAFAGDHTGALETAKGMENAALRNKAHAENAEIQAEQDNLEAAIISIEAIDDAHFRDKAHMLVAKIFADSGRVADSLSAARRIRDAYQQSQALLYLLGRDMPKEEKDKTP